MTRIQEIILHKDTGEYIMIEGYPKMPNKYRIMAKNRYGEPMERIRAYLSLRDAKEHLAKLAGNLKALDKRWKKSTTRSLLTETYGRTAGITARAYLWTGRIGCIGSQRNWTRANTS